MPGRDGTGPIGRGSLTGRGLGVCSGINAVSFGARRGMRAGRGAGFGVRRIYDYPIQDSVVAKTEMESLEEQKQILQNRLDNISVQLDGISEDKISSKDE